MPYAIREDQIQSAHVHSLIIAFFCRLYIQQYPLIL